MAVNYANGFVPSSALAPLDGQPGRFLRADAASAWNAARAEVKRRTGIVLTVRGWNRTYAEQVTFYLQRHKPWKTGLKKCCYWEGHGWYTFTGTAHAAPPGTSNHGWGLAVDVNDYGGVGNFSHPRRVATFPILAQYGWTDTEGRGAIREPWHLVWNPSSAWAVNNPIGGGGSVTIPTTPGAPAPLTPEDDMQADEREALFQIRDVLGARGGLNTSTDQTVAFLVRTIAPQVADVQAALTSALPQIVGGQAAIREDTWDVRAALTSALPKLAAASGGQVDIPALAAALNEALSKGMRADLINRLKD